MKVFRETHQEEIKEKGKQYYQKAKLLKSQLSNNETQTTIQQIQV